MRSGQIQDSRANRFPHSLDVEYDRKTEVSNESKICNLNIWGAGITMYQYGTQQREVLGEEIKSLVLDILNLRCLLDINKEVL